MQKQEEREFIVCHTLQHCVGRNFQKNGLGGKRNKNNYKWFVVE